MTTCRSRFLLYALLHVISRIVLDEANTRASRVEPVFHKKSSSSKLLFNYPDYLDHLVKFHRIKIGMAMISTRTSAEGNTQRSDEALRFAELFFHKQDKEKENLCEMYHAQSTLIWNGSPYKTKTSIAKFYQSQKTTETTVQALDAQLMPPMGDIIDMITVIAGGKIKQNDRESNFSRTFLLGPSSPNSPEYLIVSDTMRIHS